MAMTKCKECGNEISDKAESCPKCGAKQPKGVGAGTIILVSLIGFMIIMSMINSYSNKQNERPMTPEEKAAKAREDLRFQKTAAVASVIKRNLRNPDSVVWETVLANDDGSVICIQYRAQNAYGGMAREIVVVTKSGATQAPAVWNRHCTKPLNNMSHIKYAL